MTFLSKLVDGKLSFFNCWKNINAYKYSFFPRSMNIWNRLPCSAVSHAIPCVDNFHKFSIPAIRLMQPLYVAALMFFKFIYFFIPSVNNSVLFTSYF